MKIKQIRCWRKDLKLTRPYEIAFKKIDVVENIFVSIHLENGIIGVGSGNPSYEVTGENLSQTEQIISDFINSHILEGLDIRNFFSLIKILKRYFINRPAAMAAIDIALHDCFGKYLNVSIVDMYGRQKKAIATSVTIGIKNSEETIEEAKEFVQAGFKILKVKLGHDLKIDIERLIKLREIFKNIKIRVDANQGYSIEETNKFLELSENLHLELVEQPVPTAQFPIAVIKKHLKKIAADESIINLKDAIRLVTSPVGCFIYNIKLMKCGGISAAMEIANIGDLSNVQLMWGCNDESIISITAALHAAYSNKNTAYIDLDGSFDLINDVVSDGFMLKDGMLYLTDGIGLGVSNLNLN